MNFVLTDTNWQYGMFKIDFWLDATQYIFCITLSHFLLMCIEPFWFIASILLYSFYF